MPSRRLSPLVSRLAVLIALSAIGPSALRAASREESPPLIRVTDIAPNVRVDLRYATPDNFTGHVLYDAGECWLCEPAARRLARVQRRLEKEGLGLKVWDCYRPISVQKKLWALVPDPRYVADPQTGSRHNRGASVDVTLVDAQGRELAMPTPFDEFSERAHRSYMNLPAEAIKNRQRLEDAMTAEGFLPLATEWWHFDDPDWKRFALRDEPLSNAALEKDKASGVPLPASVGQLVVVRARDWSSTTGRLQRYERRGDAWQTVGSSWTVSLGLHGLSWGLGEQPGVEEGPRKKEGDLRAPAGVFPLGRAYGYEAAPPEGTRWPYTEVGPDWVCVDDSSSASYNRVFRARPDAPKDWKTAEHMRRSDHLYKWVINVEQNTDARPACGSCIFLHVWRRENSGTEGCTAMPEDRMIELLRWLDPAKDPHLVQLPDAAYERVRAGWRLP